MKTHHGLILLLTEKSNNWAVAQLGDYHDFLQFSELKEAVKTLQNIRYDLIMVDDELFGDLIFEVVAEIKRQFPGLPTIILTQKTDADYQGRLMRTGVDDVLLESMSHTELRLHVRMMLKQCYQYRASIRRQQNLYTISVMPRLLEGTANIDAVISQSMKVISSMFQLNGVVVILNNNGDLRLYAGNNDILGEQSLYESHYADEDNDPFLWTMNTGIVQRYEEIKANRSFVEIPPIPNAKKADILPLVHHGQALGALGIFPAEDVSVTHEDLLIFEQFAVQLASALRNMSEQTAQRRNIMIHTRLLEAWKLFADVQTPEDVASTLCRAVERIPNISRALVWLNTNVLDGTTENWFDSHHPAQIEQVPPSIRDGLVTILEDQSPGYQINAESRISSLTTLTSLLNVRHLSLFPIMLSTQVMGGLVIGTADEKDVDVDLIENLIQIVQTALERVTLSNTILENHNQLLSILCSITEGLFFVDRNNKVVLCTPQVTELTMITASNVVNRESEVLLRAIASRTQSPAQTLAQLQAAKERILDSQDTEYPSVTVTLLEPKVELYIEFIKSLGGNTYSLGWLGVIHNKSWSKHDEVFDTLVDDMRLPYAQVQSLFATLADQHGHFSYGQRVQLIGQIGYAVEQISQRWDDFHSLYKLRFGGISIDRDRVRLQDVIQRIVNSRPFQVSYRRFNLEIPANLPVIEIDEFTIERALSNILHRALAVSPENATINIRVDKPARELRVIIDDAGEPLSTEQSERIFGTSNVSPTNNVTADLALYVAGELVRRNGGRVWAEARANKGTSIIVAFPVLAEGSEIGPTQPLPALQSAARVPERELQTIMLIAGKSKIMKTLTQQLEREKFEPLVYHIPDEAVRDLDSTRLDLIVIDVALNEGNGLKLCRRMRQLTEVPIILVSDRAGADEKVQGLNAGADEFITNPISDDEMLARIRVIFSRKRIADRTSEPFIINDLYIDFARRVVFLKDQPVELTRIEYDLLYALVLNKGQTLTHKQLLTQVWGPEYQDETQYLWVNISRLRKKLEPTQSSPRYIRTQPGIGYYFAPN
jgi:two-component system KDP operon response regulator KdpE